MWTSPRSGSSRDRTAHLVRTVLASFLLAFVVIRLLVLLVSAPGGVGLQGAAGSDLRHLNYGMFLLAIVGGFLLFVRPGGSLLSALAAAYGIGLALTLDDCGAWLYLGGSYRQRAGFDAVVTIATLLALVGAAPRLRHFRPPHWWLTAAVVIAVGLFGGLLVRSCGQAPRAGATVELLPG